MYNKNQFKKVNDKKVLHKIKKHWAVISVALLGLLGGGAVTTTHVSANANADNQNNNNNQAHQQVNTNQLQNNQSKLVSNNTQSNNNVQSNVNNSNPSQNITKEANQLHSKILMGYMNQTNYSEPQKPNRSLLSSSNSKGMADNSVVKPNINNQSLGVTLSSNNHANPNQIKTGTYDGLNYKYDPSKQSVEFTNGTLNWNGMNNNAFIGTNDNAPSDIHNAEHITFDKNINTNNITNMHNMFFGNTNVQSINLSDLNTSNVTNMSGMFFSDINLSSLDLHGWNTSHVTNMSWMFSNISNVMGDNLDLSSFDTSSVVNMNDMFYNTSINNLNISNFDTTHTKQMNNFLNIFPNEIEIGPNTKLGNTISFSKWNEKNGESDVYDRMNLNDGTEASVDSDSSDNVPYLANGTLDIDDNLLATSTGQNITNELKDDTLPAGTYFLISPTPIAVSDQNGNYDMINGIFCSNMSDYHADIKNQILNVLNKSNFFNKDYTITPSKKNYKLGSYGYDFNDGYHMGDDALTVKVNKNFPKFIQDASHKIYSDVNTSKQYQPNNTLFKNYLIQLQYYLSEPIDESTAENIGYIKNDANKQLSNIINNNRGNIKNDYSDITGGYGYRNSMNSISNDIIVKADPNVTSGINIDKGTIQQAISAIAKDESNPTMSNINKSSYEVSQASNAVKNAYELLNEANQYGSRSASASPSPESTSSSNNDTNSNQIQVGTYDGLNYKYDPSKQSVEFTNGTLTWEGNHSNNHAFIGANDNAPSNITNAKHINFDKGINMNGITSLHNMFFGDINAQSIDLSDLDTSHVTNMSNMFESDTSLKSLNLDNINTSNVTNMNYMFNGTRILDSLNLSSFDTRKASMKNFFGNLNEFNYHIPTILKVGPLTQFKNGIIKFITLNGSDNDNGYNPQNNNPYNSYNSQPNTFYPSIKNKTVVLLTQRNSSISSTMSMLEDKNGNNITSKFKDNTETPGIYYLANPISVYLNNQNNQRYMLQNNIFVPSIFNMGSKNLNVSGFNYDKYIPKQISNIIKSSTIFNNDFTLDKKQNYNIKELPGNSDYYVNINVNENYAKFIKDANSKVGNDLNNAKQYQPIKNESDISDNLITLQNDFAQTQHDLTKPADWNTVTDAGAHENDANNNLSRIIDDALNNIENDYSDINNGYGYSNSMSSIANNKIVKADPNVTSGIDTDKGIVQQAINAVSNDASNPTMSNINNASYEVSQASNAVKNAYSLSNQANQYASSKANNANSQSSKSASSSKNHTNSNKIQTGTYDGLDYKYDPSKQSVEFTGGTLNWDGSNNHAFIGTSDNAPSNIHDAEHVKFDKGINMNNVTSLHNMFLGNTNVQSIDLSNLDTSHITDMSNMFESDDELTSLDLNNINTNNVTNMNYMFYGTSLNSLNLSTFDTRKASMKNFFGSIDDGYYQGPIILTIGPLTTFKKGVFNFNTITHLNTSSDSDYNPQNNNPAISNVSKDTSDIIKTVTPNLPIGSISLDNTNRILMDDNGNNVTSKFKDGTESQGTYYIANPISVELNNQDNQQYMLQNPVIIPVLNGKSINNFKYNTIVKKQLLNIIDTLPVFNKDFSLDKSQNYAPITDSDSDDGISNIVKVNVHENYKKFIQDAYTKVNSDLINAKQYKLSDISLDININSIKKDIIQAQHDLTKPANWNTVVDAGNVENNANNCLSSITDNARNNINNNYNDIAGKYGGYINTLNSILNKKDVKADSNVTSSLNADKSIIQQTASVVAQDASNPTMSNVNNANYEKSRANDVERNAYSLEDQAEDYASNKAHPKLPNIPSGSSSNVQSELNSFLDSMNSSISNSVSAMEASYSSEVANDNTEINSLNSKMSSRSTNPKASTATNDASLQASFSNYVSGTNAEINSLTSQVNSLFNGKTTNPTNPTNNNDASEINSLNSKINSMAQNTNVPTSNTNTGNNTALQSSFSNYVKNTNAEINSLNNKISGMAQNTNTPTSNNDASLQSSYNSYVNSTNAEINSLSNKINTSTPTNDASEVNSLNSKINSMKQNIPTVPNYSSLQSSYSNYVSDTNAEISSLNSKISDMSQNTNVPTNNDSAMSAYVDNTNSEISSLTNHINSMPQSNPAPANNNDSALQASYSSYVSSTNAEISSLATEMRDSAANSNYPTNPSEATSATPSSASDLNDLSVGQGVQYKNGVVTRSPMHYNLITINKDCLLHNHLSSVGKITDYAGVLKRGTTVKIIKAFSFKVNGHKYYRYEINLNGNNYYVTANPTFTINTYIMPTEVKNHRRAVISKPCFMYLHGHKHLLRHGSSVHIKRVIRHGKVTRLQLTNGAIITANRRFVKLI